MAQSIWPTEVAEADATGEIKAIYQDIKNVLGVAMVNLLYRRLAVEPAALRWAWDSIRAAAVDGELERGVSALSSALANSPIPDVPIAALRCVGIDPDTQGSILDVIDAFNDANPRNLIGVCIWAALLEGRPRSGRSIQPAPDHAPRTGKRNFPPLPPMISIDQMDADTAGVVKGYLKWRDPAETPSVPSLYRHLAHWPSFLAMALVAIGPLFSTGSVAATQKSLRSAAKAKAEDILSRSTVAPPMLPEGKALSVIKEIAAVYPTRISELVVVGHTMRSFLTLR